MTTPVIIMVQCSNNIELKLDERKAKSKNVNFIFSVQPIHYISRACGLMPFSIIHSSNGEILEPKIRKFDVLWFGISICVYSAMAYVFYLNVKFSQDPNTKSYFLVVGDYMLYIAVLIYGVLVRGMDMCNRFNLVEILKCFTMFDKEVGPIIFLNVFKCFTFRYSIHKI